MVKSDKFDVGSALNALIARSGKEKLALAAHLGVSEQAVQKWIKKGTIARENIRGICLFLDCSADELLGLTPIRQAGSAQLSHSHLVRLDPVILSQAYKALLTLDPEADHPISLANLDDAAHFVQVYEMRAAMPVHPSQEELIEFGRKLAMLTPTGGDDGRGGGAMPAEGAHKGKVAGKVRRKA